MRLLSLIAALLAGVALAQTVNPANPVAGGSGPTGPQGPAGPTGPATTVYAQIDAGLVLAESEIVKQLDAGLIFVGTVAGGVTLTNLGDTTLGGDAGVGGNFYVGGTTHMIGVLQVDAQLFIDNAAGLLLGGSFPTIASASSNINIVSGLSAGSGQPGFAFQQGSGGATSDVGIAIEDAKNSYQTNFRVRYDGATGIGILPTGSLPSCTAATWNSTSVGEGAMYMDSTTNTVAICTGAGGWKHMTAL